MQKANILYATILLVALAPGLGGCLGGGGGGGLPAVDMSSVQGTGADATPYELPGEMPAGTSGGIPDYFGQGGYWLVPLSRTQVDFGVAAPVIGALKYNADTDQWILTAGGTDYGLGAAAGGGYASPGCEAGNPAACVSFDPYESAAHKMYGMFATGWYDDGADAVTAIVGYGGLKTPGADMPATGTATYSGEFRGVAADIGAAGIYRAEGAAAVGVNFAAAGDQVTFTSAGNITAEGGGLVAYYTLDGSATITGNEYAGAGITGSVTLVGDADPLETYSGGIEGAFFGPGAAQTAGMVETTGDDSGAPLVGGFWAAQ